MKKIVALILISFLINGCISIRPFKRSTFEVREGYLSIKNINENIEKQMPIVEKVGKNGVKIVSTTLFASKNPHYLIAEVEFIFTSYEIPEGLPAIARFNTSLRYDTASQEFSLNQLKLSKIRYLKEDLLEYLLPQQQKFIPETLKRKLSSLILYKSKKSLRTIKKIDVKEGQIKVTF
ncbi:MAG TPA: hypothetical protein ENL00_01950 [Nitratifractor sp.]|nr:hypothetical protein [Nitratifractor sp.]